MAAWETFERSELWEPVAINRHSGAILSGLSCILYCCVFITRLQVCPLCVGKSTRRDINIDA